MKYRGVPSLPDRVHARLLERPSTFSELVDHFGMTSPRQRKDLFDAVASVLSRGLVARMGDRGSYLYTCERPALPAIDVQPVPFLTVSLGLVLDRAA